MVRDGDLISALEAADLGFCLCLFQITHHLICGRAAKLLTEITTRVTPHAQHRLGLLVLLVGQQSGNDVDGARAALERLLCATIRRHAGKHIFCAGGRAVI
jgi:hypothetical protein